MKILKYGSLFLKRPFFALKRGVLASEEQEHKTGLQQQYNRSQLPTVELMDLFPVINETVKSYTFLDGTSPISDMLLLRLMTKRFKQCEYLEIGSWRGESLANVAELAHHCTCVTLSPEDMISMNGKRFNDVYGMFAAGIKNKTEIFADSRKFDFKTLNKKFDLIFVDGDHSYNGVLNDTKKIFDLRKDNDSVIVWHDYGYSTETVRYSVFKAILDGVPPEKHKNLYHVSNTMCAVYLENSDLPVYNTQFPTKPVKIFDVQVTAARLP